ncbi:proline racemase family protein [Streptomyces sp. NPDC004609]|uniref:proline racemase family protein n=1 Tax=Streptomyces sp. NPDC004609 TaxID=3364704 RepID=UPI0036BFCF0B
MNHTSQPSFLASGNASGQPVACFDATSLAHGASSMARAREALTGALDQVRAAYFDRMRGDPGAIVAVVTRPARPDADEGLLFVTADGVLGGCGEATMFACATRSPGTGSTVVFDTAATGGPIRGTDDGAGSVSLRMPTVDEPSVSHPVTVPSQPFRTVTVSGNSFLVVPADAVGLGLDDTPEELLATRGDALLREASAVVVRRTGQAPPALLLLTEPVVGCVTRSAVVWGNAVLNRGPCGTGTCARLVTALEDGEMGADEVLTHHSPFGPAFEARLDTRSRLDPAKGLDIVLRGRVETLWG